MFAAKVTSLHDEPVKETRKFIQYKKMRYRYTLEPLWRGIKVSSYKTLEICIPTFSDELNSIFPVFFFQQISWYKFSFLFNVAFGICLWVFIFVFVN